jgi:hypothetical protein
MRSRRRGLVVVMAVNSSLLGMYGIRSTQKYYGRLTSRLAVQNIESTRLRSRRRGVVVMMAGVHTAAWWVCMAYVLRGNTAVVLQHISPKSSESSSQRFRVVFVVILRRQSLRRLKSRLAVQNLESRCEVKEEVY